MATMAPVARARGRGDRARRAWMVRVVAVACAWACAPAPAEAFFKRDGVDHPTVQKVCFIGATVPWTFGAYQSQQRGLSSAFAQAGYETLWMPRALTVRLPPGEYASWRDVRRLKPKVRMPTKSEQVAIEHLKYIGVPDIEFPGNDGMNANGLTMSQLNAAAEAHDIDAYVLLMDVGILYVDRYEFDVPTLLWMPYHHEDLDAQGAVLQRLTAVAALAPSTGRAVEKAGVLTRAIPHFIDRRALNDLADEFEARVKSDAVSLRTAVFDSKMYDRAFKREIDGVDDDTFVVLMQGGNYEDSDRKGWISSIYAYAKFQRDNPGIKTHLWVHAVDSAMVEADMNAGSKPPVAVTRTGVALRHVLERSGIPSNMYTFDENKHDHTFTSALKRHASVCLHTSKAEGFGMVVLECQALGTPVITTKYTAMRDYTKLGYTIEPAAFQSIQSAFFAMVNVDKAAEALKNIATGAAELESLESTFEWIDTELSLGEVFKKFESLLADAVNVHAKTRKWSSRDTFSKRPLFTVINDEYPRLALWSTPWTMYHHPSVKVDYELIQAQMIQQTTGTQFYGLAVAPTRGANGVVLPFDPQDGVHNINPNFVLLVPTWSLRQVQEQHSYIWSAAYAIMNSFRSQKYLLALPDSAARIDAQYKDEL